VQKGNRGQDDEERGGRKERHSKRIEYEELSCAFEAVVPGFGTPRRDSR
jgi:hypothetical protein